MFQGEKGELVWTSLVSQASYEGCPHNHGTNLITLPTLDAGHAYIIDRTNGFLIRSLLDLHSDRIWGVQVFENKILATASSNGFIKFHEIMEDYEIKLMYEEERYGEYRYSIAYHKQ